MNDKEFFEVYFDVLKERPFNKIEINDILSKNSEYIGWFFRAIYTKSMGIYYNFPAVFRNIKENIFISFRNINNEIVEFEFSCLNACLIFDLNKAKEFVFRNISIIESSWLYLILSSALGRDVDFALNIFAEKNKALSLDRARIFEKYLISQKVGKSFENLNGTERKITNLGQRKIKVAVCVSGQLRGARSAKLTWDRYFQECEVHYYVHTWENNTVSLKRESSYNRIYPKSLKDSLISISNKDSDLANYIYSSLIPSFCVDEDTIISIYGRDVNFSIEKDNSSFSNSEKMYYKIYSCYKLIEKPDDYDIIVRIRPDLALEYQIGAGEFFNSLLKNENNNKNCIYAEYGYNFAYYGFGVDDKIAIGVPEVMGSYSSLWEFKESFDRIHGHTTLAEYLFDKRINVSPISNGFKTFICENVPVENIFHKISKNISY